MDAIYSKLDHMQFGSLKRSSAMDALISMFNCWYSNADGNGKTICIFLLDFSKAFDRINHKILDKKMLFLDINKSLVNWVIEFPMLRKLRMKLGTKVSDWSQ